MDESQEQLLKRLTLLKQKIREQYPELSDIMAEAHLKNLQERESQNKEIDKKKCQTILNKKDQR